MTRSRFIAPSSPSSASPRRSRRPPAGAVGALYLLAAWRAIVANRPSLLIAAGLFLAAAVNAERIAPAAPDLAEAGLTFLAVAFWAGFHVLAAARIVEELATGRITAVALSSARLVRRA